MEKILKYFATLLGMVEEAILRMFAEVSKDPVEDAYLRLEVMQAEGLEYRRLKLAIGQPVAAPSFEYGNAPYLTDDEIKTFFLSANTEARVAFVQAMMAGMAPVAERVKILLAAIQTEIANKKAEEQKRQAQLQSDIDARQRLAEEAQRREVQRVWTDEEALAYIRKAPEGRFYRPEELARFIKDGQVTCMVTKKTIPVDRASVVGFCLITETEMARRVAKKMARKNWAPTVPELMQFLEGRAKEADNISAQAQADVDAADSLEKLALLVAEVLAYDATKDHVKPTWQAKLRVDELRKLAFEKRERMSDSFVRHIHSEFGHQNLPDLEAKIERMQSEIEAKKAEAGVPHAVIRSLEFRLRICKGHREWLAAHPQQENNVVSIRRGDPEEEKRRLAHRYCMSVNMPGLKPEEELAEYGKRARNKGKGDKKARNGRR